MPACPNCSKTTPAAGLCKLCRAELNDLPAEFREYILDCEKLLTNVANHTGPDLDAFLDQFTLKVKVKEKP